MSGETQAGAIYVLIAVVIGMLIILVFTVSSKLFFNTTKRINTSAADAAAASYGVEVP